jgi:hypothetical protein
LYTPTGFTNTFVGTVLNHDGSNLSDISELTPPPVYSGPDGVFLLGDKAPTVDTGADIFLNILGRAPNPGEQVTTWDTVSSVPEPASMAVAGFGAAIFVAGRFLRQKSAKS